MGKCKAKTEVYSRVCGFYRPVQSWNPGKRAEFHDRVPYAINKKTLGALLPPKPKPKEKS
ncbi:MAG TPA: anaerobic ribonucleoside-triphosphate reductase [bacterium]|nr:anaerobic ribonucleoside-triphosphate reductase [bacterium]